MPQFFRDHIIINGRTETLPYVSNQSGRAKVIPRQGLDRTQHGQDIRQQFETAVETFDDNKNLDFVYLTFRSPVDLFLDIDKLDKSDCRLSTYKEIEQIGQDGQMHRLYEATVYLNTRAISKFLKKIDEYIAEDTKGGNPKNLPLIANIDGIRAATLESFWQEPELPFPETQARIWWEVWLHRDVGEDQSPIEALSPFLNNEEIEIGNKYLRFPEHFVFLIQGTADQLSRSLLYSDKLSELRKPRESADFFTYLDKVEQQNWIQELLDRIDNNQEDSQVSICLLDTGVTITNPLLTPFIPEKHLDRIIPTWHPFDSHIQGHGTPMAGLALFGDLTDAFVSLERIPLNHHIESIKLIERNHNHAPHLYGAVTIEAVARAEVINPPFKRVVCMAVTANNNHKGRPSSWSSAIDQFLFGLIDERNNRTIFCVSSGNLDLADRINYPLSNEDASIEDPAQSFNAITVGAYTLKDDLDLQQFNGAELLAQRGAMSPCNTSSVQWYREWCRKPDIVMEGGNQAAHNGGAIDPDSLQLLSTSKGGLNRPWLTTFADTSASTALASRFAAQLYSHYPHFWPETIRALIIHSADWTSTMLSGRTINQLTSLDRAKLFCFVGYGVPNLQRAMQSANNSLSLIVERALKPYRKDGSQIKTDSFHVFDLPWPTDVLDQLAETVVKFKITLSYFIEPNPGNKRYDLAASYRSHGLRFKMIDANERPAAFKARVSKAMREEGYEVEGQERWILGGQLRDKGSIHKDIWEGTAAELSTRSKIAVYPVGGWWRTRKALNRFEHSVRYSLIMTIETPSEETDIYTPVLNQIEIQL